jgi:hypothetical protein
MTFIDIYWGLAHVHTHQPDKNINKYVACALGEYY